jgi:hypothetical protein
MGHLLKIKCVRFKGEGAHFSFNKCPIYTHDSASAKISTNSYETDNSDACSTSLGTQAEEKRTGYFQNVFLFNMHILLLSVL